MRYLTLGDLSLACNDLLNKRLSVLQLSGIGRVYQSIFTRRRDQLNNLPQALLTSKPLAEELSDQDTIHDDSLGTIWHTTESVLRSTRASATLKAAAQHIRDKLGLSLSDTSTTRSNCACSRFNCASGALTEVPPPHNEASCVACVITVSLASRRNERTCVSKGSTRACGLLRSRLAANKAAASTQRTAELAPLR